MFLFTLYLRARQMLRCWCGRRR